MKFTLSITVPEGEVGQVLARFSKRQVKEIVITQVPEQTKEEVKTRPGTPPKRRRRQNAKVAMEPAKGYPKGEARVAFMRLLEGMEAEHGIGTIGRVQLLKEAELRRIVKAPKSTLSGLLTSGHIVYVD